MYYFPKILQKLKLTSIYKCKIDKRCRILGGCDLHKVSVGRYSYVGSNTIIANANIGSFCSIAGGCMIGGGSHPIQFVTTSPVFCEGRNCLHINFARHDFDPYSITTIENDVWIGAGCYISAGVHISTGAVLGMGSVLTHDIPPYEIWAGNPARKIRDRFDENVKKKLLDSKWWDWNDVRLKKMGDSFNNVDVFMSNLDVERKCEEKT